MKCFYEMKNAPAWEKLSQMRNAVCCPRVGPIGKMSAELSPPRYPCPASITRSSVCNSSGNADLR
jgi:hypothetical protein